MWTTKIKKYQAGMKVSIHTINTSGEIPICTSIEDMKTATEEDSEPQMLKRYITSGWPDSRKAEKYWLIRHELTMKDGIVMKCKCIIIPLVLQKQILEQLHSNHMGITKHSYSWGNQYIELTQMPALSRLSSSVSYALSISAPSCIRQHCTMTYHVNSGRKLVLIYS